jgi:YHS domain-containing protein
MTMRTIARAFLALMLLSTPLLAADLVNVAGASHIAINGYDPVAFFTDSKPVSGSPSISVTHQGAVYFFATEEHKRSFTQNPDKYVPQYGGFCAFGVGLDALFPVDITTWQIRNDRLYLNLNQDILQKFNADFDANVVKADKNWPGLVKKNRM